uniref:DUF6247 family protein n=1 Tax=Streptomyces sp. MH60 TaxID=1940758 RepID=UPI000CEEEBE1
MGARQITPAALPAFTRELDQAADQSRQGSDLAPLQRFIAQWAAHVYIRRQPDLAADLQILRPGQYSSRAAAENR